MEAEFTIVGAAHMSTRDDGGTYQVGYRVTVGDQSGLAFYHYEYQKRDVMEEQLYAEPNIAPLLVAHFDDESPSVTIPWPETKDDTENPAALKEAREAATETVWGY
jgi:hypothetical protein